MRYGCGPCAKKARAANRSACVRMDSFDSNLIGPCDDISVLAKPDLLFANALDARAFLKHASRRSQSASDKATMTDNRDYPARPILAASAAVFKPDGTVLLGARRIGPYAGVFSLPGGLVETGETLEEAALRELEEETGVRGEIVAFNGWREVINREDDGRVKRHYVIVFRRALGVRRR